MPLKICQSSARPCTHKIQPNVRISPKATELPRGSEMTLWVDYVEKSEYRLGPIFSDSRGRDVPPEYGPATTIYNRYNRWSQRGLWQRLFEQIAASGDVPRELSLDSSHVKAHRSAAGAKGGSGRKRSGARAAVAPRKSIVWPMIGRLVAFALTPGNVADISMAVPLLSAVMSPKHLIADKVSDADSWVLAQNLVASGCYPSNSTERVLNRSAAVVSVNRRCRLCFGRFATTLDFQLFQQYRPGAELMHRDKRRAGLQ